MSSYYPARDGYPSMFEPEDLGAATRRQKGPVGGGMPGTLSLVLGARSHIGFTTRSCAPPTSANFRGGDRQRVSAQ